MTDVPVTATLGSQIVDVGVIQTTLSGPGKFFFRDPAPPWQYPVQFAITIDIQTSVPVTGGALWFAQPVADDCSVALPLQFRGPSSRQ